MIIYQAKDFGYWDKEFQLTFRIRHTYNTGTWFRKDRGTVKDNAWDLEHYGKENDIIYKG